jgi:hypothetical protein
LLRLVNDTNTSMTHEFDWTPTPYFWRLSALGRDSGEIVGAAFRVMGTLYPTFMANIDEMAALAKNTFRYWDNPNYGMSEGINYNTWHQYHCFLSYRFSYGCPGKDWISGLDTRGLHSTMSFEVEIGPANPGLAPDSPSARPFIIAECTSLLRIGAGRSVSVIP